MMAPVAPVSYMLANVVDPVYQGESLAGVTIFNTLPALHFVDLDKECVVVMGGEINALDMEGITQALDDVVDSGVLPNGIHWGITKRTDSGFADILVDAAEITEETIRQLIRAKVITVRS